MAELDIKEGGIGFDVISLSMATTDWPCVRFSVDGDFPGVFSGALRIPHRCLLGAPWSLWLYEAEVWGALLASSPCPCCSTFGVWAYRTMTQQTQEVLGHQWSTLGGAQVWALCHSPPSVAPRGQNQLQLEGGQDEGGAGPPPAWPPFDRQSWAFTEGHWAETPGTQHCFQFWNVS